MPELILIAHNLRSTHNVGAIIRTADGMGIKRIYLTGYTPYPRQKVDERLPHLITRVEKQLNKTALGALYSVETLHEAEIKPLLADLKNAGFKIAALEQATGAINLSEFKPPQKLAIIVGREVEGIEEDVIKACDLVLEIPMLGSKESLNVASAAAIAMYHCRFL